MSGEWVRLPPMRRERLDNGLTIIVAERRVLPLVSLRLAFRAGSSQDPVDRAGLAAFTARLLRHGAGERDERAFAEDLDAIGGHFGASIGLDLVNVDAEFTTQTWEEGRGLVLDALLRPHFPEAAVARERGRAVSEIEQSHDEPDHVASRAFQRFLYEGHAYGHPPEGTRASLLATTRDDAAGYWRDRLIPDGSVLVIVGDVDAGEELARWRDLLGSWRPVSRAAPPPDDAPDPPAKVILVHDEGAGQAQWRTGGLGFRRTTPLYPRLILANTILGGGFTSRLVQQVRVERGLTYGIGSRFLLGFSRGPFEIGSFTKNSTLVQMHEIVRDELAEYRRTGATQAELDAARAYVLGLHVLRFETPEGLGSALCDAELHGLGLEAITGFRQALEAVTLQDVNAAIPDLFPAELLTVVVGDAEELAGPCATLGPLTTVATDFAEGMTP